MKERAQGLPSHEFALYSGIITNFRYEDIGPNGLAQAVNVDPADTYRALGKVPGSTLASASHGASVESLHYFEALDLHGSLQRQVISLAGGALYSVNTSTLAITSLATGLTSEAMVGITYNDRLHLASPNNDPKKVDVAGQVSRWGVVPPGSTEETLLLFTSEALWSVNGSNTKADSTSVPPSFSTPTTSVQVNKVDTSITTAILTRAGLGLDFSGAGQDIVNILLYLPAGSLAKLATSGTAVQIRYGDAGLSNANANAYSIGVLAEGWNLFAMDTSAPTSQSGTGASLASVDTIELTISHASIGTTQSGYLWTYLFEYDEGAPTVAISATGNVTGTKSYVVTFVSRYGQESNGGPASEPVVAAGSQVALTAVPVSADSQVIARRVYRDNAGDQVYRFVDQIDDNTSTAFTDNVANADLELTGPPLAGDPDNDNDFPPRLRDVVLFRNHVFGIVESQPFRIRISDVNEPESWPTANELVFDDEVQGLENVGDGLLIYTSDRIYGLTGSTMEDFFTQQLNPEVGCSGRRAHCNPKGIAPMVWHEDGPWYVFNPQDPWFVGASIQDQIEDLTNTQFENIWMLHDRKRFRVIVFIPASATSMQKIWVWSYGKRTSGGLSGEGAGLDPTEIRSGGWFDLSLGVAAVPRCAVVSETTAEQPEVLIGCADGRIYKLQDPDATNYASGTGSYPVSMTIETLDVPLSADRDGRGAPRYLAVNGYFNAETTLSFTVTTRNDAKGKVNQTRSWTTTFSSGQQSKIIPVPGPGLKGAVARVKIENAEGGVTPVITSLRLYFVPGHQFTGPR